MSINHLLQPSSATQDINGNQATVALRSYQHGKKIFVDSNYRLSPKYGFLFYVEFDFNPLISNVSNTAAQEMGMIVKSVNLPKFTIDTKVHNAYNRVNISQHKIKYDAVNITFHDDQADNVRNFWYDYYSFYYRDSDYADATYNIPSKYQERATFQFGYTPRPNASYNASNAFQNYQYIQAVRIYSLYQKNFSEYELVNPIITSFKHGEHQNGESTFLEHSMTLEFETVKYLTGYTTQNTAGGFIDLHYDNTPSPIAPAAGVDIVDNGQGGYATIPNEVNDLANNNVGLFGAVTPDFSTSASLNIGAVAYATTAGTATTNSAKAMANAGGFALPSLGSLTTGITNSNIIGQQISSATVNLAGSAASTLAGGVISGVTKGLGPQGTQLVGLAAQAIANPSAALLTVENMAIKYATGLAQNTVNNLASQAGNYLSNQISENISKPLATWATGIATSVGDAASNLGKSALAQLPDNYSLGTGVYALPTADAYNIDNEVAGYTSIGDISIY